MSYDADDFFQNENYQNWRRIHTNAFGDIFAEAFSCDEASQYLLTAALIDISKRCVDTALPRLDKLSEMCAFPFDEAVVDYFKGLCYEIIGDEELMTEYYEDLRAADMNFHFPIAFHPYYRTAKFAQRDAECSKAIYYYQKALAFYEHAKQTPSNSEVASQIIYDIATVCLYMHQYDLAEKTLALSEHYSSDDNSQRQYVIAVLKAVQGKYDDSDIAVNTLPDYLRSVGKATVNAIRSGTDLHYNVIPQDRSSHPDFVKWVLSNQPQWNQLLSQGNLHDVENIISGKLTATFPFMQKALGCHIEAQGSTVIVKCKTYCVKTLKAEYSALFSTCRQAVTRWQFVAVDEFETYPLI